MSVSALGPLLLLAAAASAGPSVPGAPEAPPPARPMYVALSGSSTVSYLPPGGRLLGPQADFSPSVGFGVGVLEGVYVGVDLAPTWARGALTGVSVTPGAFWCFHPNLYVAARTSVAVYPAPGLAVVTGLGAMLPLGPRFTAFSELGALSTVGRGSPDLGISLSLGVFLNL